MIIVLILITWLTIITIIVNACRSAARGDEVLAQATSSTTPRRGGRIAQGGGVLWADGPALTGTRHAVHVGAASGPRIHAARVRGSRCATGS